MGREAMRSLDAWLAGRSKNAILFIALLLALLIGVCDRFITVDLIVLYLLPILIAAWYGGRQTGLVIAVYCAGSVFVLQSISGGDVDLLAVVNLVIRVVTYLAMAWMAGSLQESRRQQRELTGFIVHDLRSPIASSITGLQTLEAIPEGMDDLQKEMVALALVSNQRALTLVNGILDVEKLESGKMEVRKESTPIEQMFQDCIVQVALWAQSNRVEIETRTRVEQALLDPELTQRVLVNLLSNALKFSPEDRKITLEAERQGNMVRFAVRDQGPGIPPEYVDTLFEPFSQVKGTKGGTGLGLTFCRLAVQAQGGRIWIESKLGEGTAMLFTLPV
ncbi:HAMP domain-containing histidine kinase [bacterium]|nr:MAG: HAMP domain-containing histidine kinase [bacterium]